MMPIHPYFDILFNLNSIQCSHYVDYLGAVQYCEEKLRNIPFQEKNYWDLSNFIFITGVDLLQLLPITFSIETS